MIGVESVLVRVCIDTSQCHLLPFETPIQDQHPAAVRSDSDGTRDEM